MKDTPAPGQYALAKPYRTAIFDIETDGLLEQLTVLHCLCILIVETGEVISCTDNDPRYPSIQEGLNILTEADLIVGHNIIKFDIPAIQKVHPDWTYKGKAYDTLAVSQLIYSDMKEKDFARRNALKRKHGEKRTNEMWPGSIIGRHGLDAWGIRLGEWKGDYSKEKGQELKDQFLERHMAERAKGKLVKDCPPKAPSRAELGEYVWKTWCIEMQDYCEQDITVTAKLYALFQSKEYSPEAIDLEHDFLLIIQRMEVEGFNFNVHRAYQLERTLEVRLAEIREELQVAFPPWDLKIPFTPKASNKTKGWVKGVPTFKTKHMIFNPGSGDQVADRLKDKYGWVPTEFTDKGKPSVTEEVLIALYYPEAPLLSEAAMVAKRLAQLATGTQAWMKLVTPEGKIHHRVSTNGAVTGRCTHSNPNVAQTPSPSKPYGKDCRMLWGPPEGMKQVGADLSGLELRCLGHFMHTYDQGAYIHLVLEGDIHTFNAAALFGYEEQVFADGRKDKDTLLLTVANDHPHSGRYLRALNPGQRKVKTVADFFDFLRDNAKTFIYGFLYGGGAAKVGQIVEEGKATGQKLIDAFLDKTPALKKLREKVQELTAPTIYKKIPYTCPKTGKVKTTTRRIPNPRYRGYLKGLDGRILPIRSPHAALNTLLQSAGAILSKKATVILYQDLEEAGYVFGVDYALMAHIHDEVQLWAKPELADIVGAACVLAFEKAGEHFKFRCPITGEYKIGDNWYDTH